MTKVVVATFPSRDDAERGLKRLQDAGFAREEISVVAKDDSGSQGASQQSGGMGGMWGDASEGVTWGAGLGAGAGLLASAGALTIPGIGPLLAAGPLAAALSGAAMGGLAGGLMDWGIPEERGRYYEQQVRSGRALVAVQVEDADQANTAEQTLKDAGAQDIEIHVGRRHGRQSG